MARYKEVLSLVARGLTVVDHSENRVWLRGKMEKNEMPWDEIVKTATFHLVFPALYIQWKKAELLNFVPEDLISYMKHIAGLNRDRNKRLLEHIYLLNETLTKEGVQPIFVKGSRFLLDEIYSDPCERMLSDIDFIVSFEDYPKAAEILLANSYQKVDPHFPSIPYHRHYPRLIHPDRMGAVEVHKNLISNLVASYDIPLETQILHRNGETFHLLSDNCQVLLSILSNQINDFGRWNLSLSVKHSYDIFLLSKQTELRQAIQKMPKQGKIFLNYLDKISDVFNIRFSSQLDTLIAENNFCFERKLQNFFWENPNLSKNNSNFWKRLFKLKAYSKIIYHATFEEEYRIFLKKRLALVHQKLDL